MSIIKNSKKFLCEISFDEKSSETKDEWKVDVFIDI